MRFSTFLKKFSSPLSIVIAIEILGVGMMMAGVLPREVSLFLLGAFIFFAVFAPLKQAAFFAVFSIPLYTALPITEGFDSMASWRIIIAILFLRLVCYEIRTLYEYTKKLNKSDSYIRMFFVFRSIISKFIRTRLGVLISVFFALGVSSLFIAQEPIIGIKKILYLVNIFALFFIVNFVVKSREDFLSVLKYTFAGSLLTLAIGYAQFIAILFTPLYNFWQWWANQVIPIFYGSKLADLLSYSNTWFSYYGNGNADPTLRIFSIFPDSHSFALFMILSLPMALTLFSVCRHRMSTNFISRGVVALILLAIIFSGTRGAWLGAVPVFFVVLLLYLARKEFFRKNFPISMYVLGKITSLSLLNRGVEPACRSGRGEVVRATIFVFVIFALLFPLSSPILRFSQGRHGGEVSETTLARISKSLSFTELSNKSRIEIWKSTLSSIAKHPILGVGIGNYPVVLSENVSATKQGASAHSLYLDIISEMGIFSGLILLLIFFEILRRAIRVFLQNKDILFSVFAGFFAIYFMWVMAYSVVDVVLLNDKVLLLFVVLVGLIYSTPKLNNHVNSLHHNSR